MAVRFRQQPLINRKAPVTKGKVAGFLAFGPNNLWPQDIIDAIDESDTAGAAIDIRAEFIEGFGLEDKTLYKLVVNRNGETFDDIIAQTARNVAYGEVIVLHVTYNGNAEIVGIQTVPFEQIRFPEPDELGNIVEAGIFPYLGSTLYRKRASDHKRVYLFNPRPEVVFSQIEASGGIEKYYGQLLYLPVTNNKKEIYHQPSFWSGNIRFETERELATGDYRSVVQDFAVSGFIKALRKKPGRKEDERDDDSLQNRIEAHQGAENRGSVVVIEADTTDELDAIDFLPATGADLGKRYDSTVQRTAEAIARRTRVPNELINIRKSGSIAPTGEEMGMAYFVMQKSVDRYQRSIERALTMIMRHWYQPIPNPNFAIQPQTFNYGTVAQPE